RIYMELKIPYGKQNIIIDVPADNIIEFSCEYKTAPEITDENKIIENALENCISSKRLKEEAAGKENACILISDITRPCPSYKFLPYLIKELKGGDVKNIKIIFGLGIHRSHTSQEQEKLAGKEAISTCRVIDFDKNRCRHIGTTSFGTPVELFEEVADADFIVATGNIEYHYFAGYSGGAKAVMPGVCSYNSVRANHSMMLEENARAGQYLNNPIRQDMEEAGRIAGIDFIFNVILDDSKKIIGAVAGKNNEAFLKGIELYDSIYEISSDKKADIVIASAGGYPKDINLYQAQKALESVKEIVKENGTIILAAECPEGFGEDKFEEWMYGVSDFENLYKKIKQDFVLGGHKAVAVSKLLTSVNVLLHSSFDKALTESIGFKKLENIQDYINNALGKDNNLKIAIIPNGRFVKYCT
ncbi:MAG: nickel-dependent lactate racemase, partial [Actinobacteria bacterium]|nr:nickel-dependent lactate racemase [Actinomycetota bacterium]